MVKIRPNKWLENLPIEERICHYCFRTLIQNVPKKWIAAAATIEHSMPKSRKKKYESDQVVLACAACNSAKGDMTGEEFVHFIRTGTLASYIEWMTEKTKRMFLLDREQDHEANTSNSL